jgi:hypothetical protein
VATDRGGGTVQPTTPGTPVIAEFSIEPSAIERGQSAVLRWNVTGSNNVAISNGMGTVPPTGTQRITPQQTTSYVLTASGPGGDASRTATVTVSAPAPPPPTNTNPITRRGGTLGDRVQSDLQDALYDYDSNNIRDDARVPVIVVQSETDVLGTLVYLPARQPDNERFRLWEVAGAAHCDTISFALAADADSFRSRARGVS